MSLTDTHAIVHANGSVFWSRPGHVKPISKFRGLDDFPFDTLECTMEVGSWSQSGLYLRTVKMDEGYTVGGSETAGEAYAEFSLVSVECEYFMYPPFFPGAPEEDFPVLFYHVSHSNDRGNHMLEDTLSCRLSSPCGSLMLLLASAAHWRTHGLMAITSVLAAVASELVVAANLPVASELTWFAKFSTMSLLFTAFALFESSVVIYFYYHTGDDLVPKWCRWIQRKIASRRSNNKAADASKVVRFGDNSASGPSTDNAAQLQRNTQVNGDDIDESIDYKYNDSSVDDADDEDRAEYDDCRQDSDGSRSQENADECKAEEHVESPLNQGSDHGQSPSRKMRRGSHLASFRTRKGIKTILGRDADDFKNAKEMENNMRWQVLAKQIDDAARVVFPGAFSIYLAVAFTVLAV